MRRLPNSSTHRSDQGIRTSLYWTWQTICSWDLTTDLATVPGSSYNFLSFYQVDHITSSPHYPQKQWILLKLWWESPRNWWKNQWKKEKCGIMAYCSIGPHPSALLLHHHWRYWQEEDHIQAFHNFHPALARTWKPPEFIKSCLGGNPTTLPQEPWNWSLDNLFLSRKWMEMFGEQPLSINQQLSLIPIGWDFQTIPYWEGPDQWSSQGLHLLILSFRLKQNRGTLKEKPTHVLVNPLAQLNGQSMLPVIPMASVTNPATVDRGSKVSETPDPINSTETPQPLGGATPSIPPTPRHWTRSTKGVRSSLLYPIQEVNGLVDILCVQVVQWRI